jgi:hypothetical protein
MATFIRTSRHGVTYSYRTTSLASPPNDYSTTYHYVDSVEKGANVGEWKKKIALHASATTYLSGEKTVVDKTPGFGKLKAHTVPSFPIPLKIETTVDGDITPVGTDFDIVGDTVAPDNKALSSFLHHAYEKQRTLAGIVVAGELGETIRLIRRPAAALWSSVNDYLNFLKHRRRGAPREAKARRRFLSQSWLEFSFGWAPLISDVQSAAIAAARIASSIPETEYVFGEALTEDISVVGPGFGSADQLGWSYQVRQQSQRYVKYYGRIRANSSFGGAYTAAQTLGLDIRSFIPSVWNLIPYSFLIDYFTNLGEFLEGICFNTADVAWVNKGTRLETRRWVTDFVTTPHNLNPAVWDVDDFFVNASSSKVTKSKVTREAIGTDQLIPTFRFKIPNRPLWKAANIASLVEQHRKLLPY